MNHLCVIGFPSKVGGADTELDHQIHCWQALGLHVHLIHTGTIDASLRAMRMEERGCVIHRTRDWPASASTISSTSTNSTSRFDATHVHSLKFWGSAGYGVFQDTVATVPAANDGDPVARWNDRSGHASRWLAAPSDGDRATFATHSINGRATVNFNGSGQLLELTDGLFTADYLMPATLFAVLRIGDTAASYGRFFAKVTNGGDYEIGLQRQAGGDGRVGAVSGCSGQAWQAAEDDAPSAAGELCLMAGTWYGGTIRFYRDNTHKNTVTITDGYIVGANDNANSWSAGAQEQDGSTTNVAAASDMAEILVFNRALGESDLTKLFNWASSLYEGNPSSSSSSSPPPSSSSSHQPSSSSSHHSSSHHPSSSSSHHSSSSHSSSHHSSSSSSSNSSSSPSTSSGSGPPSSSSSNSSSSSSSSGWCDRCKLERDFAPVPNEAIDVLPGDRITLSINCGPGAQIDKIKWNIPGEKYASYSIYAPTNQLTPLGNTDGLSLVQFFWSDTGDGRTVSVTFNFNGDTCTTTATFNIKNPNVSFLANPPLMGAFIQDTTSKQFVLKRNAIPDAGILWQASITLPKPFENTLATWAFLQLKDGDRSRQLPGGACQERNTGGWVLDTVFPYGSGQSQFLTDGTPCQQGDSPFLSIDPTVIIAGEAWRDLQVYIMFKSTTGNATWVPLYKCTWYYDCCVQYDMAANTWICSANEPFPPPSAFTPYTHPPTFGQEPNWVTGNCPDTC